MTNIPSQENKSKHQSEEFAKYSKNFTHFITYTPSLARIAGGVLAGLLLSRILYWWQFAQIFKDDRYWIAKTTVQWRDELGFTEDEFLTARKRLLEKGLIVKDTFKFNSNPTTHFSLIEEKFIELSKLEYEQNSNNDCRYGGIRQNDLAREISNDELEQKILKDENNFSSVSEGFGGIRQNDIPESAKTITKKTNKEYVLKGNKHTYTSRSEPIGSSSTLLFVPSSPEEFLSICNKIPQKTQDRWRKKYDPILIQETLQQLHSQYAGKDIPIKNLPGLIESALKDRYAETASYVRINKGLARKFKEQHKLHNLIIQETGVIHDVSRKDASFSLEPTAFQKELMHIFREDMPNSHSSGPG